MTIKELLLWQNVYAQLTDESQLWQWEWIDISWVPWSNPNTYTPASNTSSIPTCTGTDPTGCNCPNGKTDDGTQCIVNKEGNLGINCSAEQLINNTCSRNINKTLGIRRSDPNPSPTLLVQDITLAATSFIGTIIVIAMIYLGIKAVSEWAGDSNAMDDIKWKIKNLAIWLILVIASYTIIRLVQFIARGF